MNYIKSERSKSIDFEELLEMSLKTVGSKNEVWFGKAKHTSGGLTQKDLVKSKTGKVISRKKQAAGKLAFSKNNLKAKTKSELANIRQKRK